MAVGHEGSRGQRPEARLGPHRLTVAGLMGLMVFTGSGAVGALGYAGSRRMADRQAIAHARQVAETATQRTLRSVEPAAVFVATTHDAARSGRLDLGPFNESAPPQAMLDHFRTALGAHPEFTRASFGAPDGTYVAAERRADGTVRGLWHTPLDEGTRMRVLVPDSVAAEGGRAWGWRVEASRDAVAEDPHERAGYRAAAGATDGVWVEVDATDGRPAFIRARVQRGRAGADPAEVQGVWTVEGEPSGLSEFLDGLAVGERGRVDVVDGAGHSLSRRESADDGMAATWAAVSEGRLGGDVLEVGGTSLVARPFPESSGLDWTVLVTVPEADLDESLRAQGWWTLGMALLAALFAALVGWLWGSRIARRS